MSRFMPAAHAAALTAPVVRLAILFEGEFASGWVRLWTGIGPLSWNGATWNGAGTLIGIGTLEDTVEVVASGTAVTLSGIPSELIQIAIEEAQQGAPGRMYLALFDEAGALVSDPVLVFGGRLDRPRIQDGAETSVISIRYESRLVDLTSRRELRYTHESQQILYPGDRAFEYLTATLGRDIKWGR